MPVHDYRCPTCGAAKEAFLKIADLGSSIYCNRCHQPMVRQLAKPWVRGDYEPYESPVVPGKIISGRREHEEHLRETGCRLLEPGESERHKQFLAWEEQKLEKKLEETADEFIANLPTEKRDRLAGEMEGGITGEVVRATPKFN